MGDEGAAAGGLGQIREFIFSRELAEVYLLLDHVSGRPDKSLAIVSCGATKHPGTDEPPKKDWIEEICEIGWPPEGTAVEQAHNAAILLKAKDRLNAMAYPASGASIAFTLLVAGEDNGESEKTDTQADPPPAVPGEGTAKTAVPPPPAPPRGAGLHGRGWHGHPPSRTSLARIAYPGLVHTAIRFNRWTRRIIALLIAWLFFTCLLSWHVTAGHAILTRLDAAVAQLAEIQKRIDAIQPEDYRTGQSGSPAPAAGTSQSQQTGATQSDADAERSAGAGTTSRRSVKPFCRETRDELLKDGSSPPSDGITSVNMLQLCDQRIAASRQRIVGQADLADWLVIWGWLKWLPHLFISDPIDIKPRSALKGMLDEQWASVLVEVLSSAVLPLFYGFLGAGAAVVRNLWGRMRDSLLSPRDLTLCFGQLALGAVIGATIGLFITPSTAGGGLTGTTTLTPSALSFIAGFGVESVFVALESLIKRIFNVSETPSPSPPARSA
jgi:hypothetical protein